MDALLYIIYYNRLLQVYQGVFKQLYLKAVFSLGFILHSIKYHCLFHSLNTLIKFSFYCPSFCFCSLCCQTPHITNVFIHSFIGLICKGNRIYNRQNTIQENSTLVDLQTTYSLKFWKKCLCSSLAQHVCVILYTFKFVQAYNYKLYPIVLRLIFDLNA